MNTEEGLERTGPKRGIVREDGTLDQQPQVLRRPRGRTQLHLETEGRQGPEEWNESPLEYVREERTYVTGRLRSRDERQLEGEPTNWEERTLKLEFLEEGEAKDFEWEKPNRVCCVCGKSWKKCAKLEKGGEQTGGGWTGVPPPPYAKRLPKGPFLQPVAG